MNRDTIQEYFRQFEIYIPENYKYKFGDWDRFKEAVEDLQSEADDVKGAVDKVETLEEEIEDLKREVRDSIYDLKQIDLSDVEGANAQVAEEMIDRVIKDLERAI